MIIQSTPLDADSESIVTEVIDAGFTVHRTLGPGFLESIYRTALHLELDARHIPGQRIDLIVAGRVLVELKAVKQLEGIHQAIVISYLKTTGLRIGLLMNFHAVLFKDGVKRIVL